MTRRELHERIALSFEPKPTLPPKFNGDMSERGAWIGYLPHMNPLLHWEAPDFDADEYANGMLLEAMPATRLERFTDTGTWRCLPDWPRMSMDEIDVWPEHSDRKHAITNAYAAHLCPEAWARYKAQQPEAE